MVKKKTPPKPVVNKAWGLRTWSALEELSHRGKPRIKQNLLKSKFKGLTSSQLRKLQKEN